MKNTIRTILIYAVATAAMGAMMLFAASIEAHAAEADKVRICHATGSWSNPYVSITVAAHAADGNTGNDNGQGDHSTHVGPVFNGVDKPWGDIIPPHDNYAGLNWTAEGQRVYNDPDGDCSVRPLPSPSPTETPSETPSPTPTESPTPSESPSPSQTPSSTGSPSSSRSLHSPASHGPRGPKHSGNVRPPRQLAFTGSARTGLLGAVALAFLVVGLALLRYGRRTT